MSLSNLLKYAKGGLKALLMIIRQPKNLYYITHQEQVYQNRVAKKYPQFIKGLPQIKLSDLTDQVSEKIQPYSLLGGTSEPIDIALLKILARRFPKCSYFEIGTWRGESIVNLMDVTSNRYTLNLPPDDMKESNPDTYSAHNHYLEDIEGVTQLFGNSLHFDFSTLPEMDLIFIDGDHHQEVVASDSRSVFNHLTHENSIIVWHDYASHYSSIWWEVLEGILDGTPSKYHDHIYHVRNTNCAVYLPFEITANSDYNQWLPEESFEIHIKMTEL
ncbi:MAG: hypothetical protein CMB80_14175 [Flammeovirgaceae bacterium]|nr:hypothetical protein [Flammeovirgaceae bacterium]MBE62426.1 hypothetical protein [Flammeovirgaceae bacterium]HCX21726.1 hypothetical protein [Cytophagales bacterium]|tara:strand:- start:4271 stop:5089 length:819 start_codon:yes stop_codon:yes gene_type:complete